MIKQSLFFTAIILSISCSSGKKAQEKPVTVTEDLKPGNPGEVTVEGAGSPASDTQNGGKPAKPVLHGSWTLEKVYGAKEPFHMLFPSKTPDVTFDARTNAISGNTGCNTYKGSYQLRENTLTISDLMTTRMFCEGVKEELFTTTLKMANGYRIQDGKLVLMLDDSDLLGFVAQK